MLAMRDTFDDEWKSKEKGAFCAMSRRAVQILEASNIPGRLMTRIRSCWSISISVTI